MSLLLLASAAHAPGTTSLAVALSVHSREETLLVDANREPDQSVLAGYLSGIDPQGRGLGSLLQTHRERRPLEAALAAATLPLSAKAQFLPGFAHPGTVSLFAPVWPDLAAALLAQERSVIVDVGRIGTTGLPRSLVDACSGLAIVTRTGLPDLAALRLSLASTVEAVGDDRVGLVLVGPDRPYSRTEIERQFGVPVWAEVAFQPEEAAVYSHGAVPGRRHLRSAYVAGVRALDHRLASRDTDRRALLRARR